MVAAIIVIAVFILQLVISLTVRSRWVRLIPVVLCTLGTLTLFFLAKTSEGWDAVGYVLLMTVALAATGAAILGALLGVIIRAIRNRKRRIR